jgi:hypothetical protein
MKDQGVVPKDKLTVNKIDGKDTTTITVTSKKQGKDTPLWVSATFTPAEVKDIKSVAFGKDGKPIDSLKTHKVGQASKPTVVEFDTPVNAHHIVFIISTPTPSKVDLTSVVGCLLDEELTTTPGVATTTHPEATTTHSGQTTVHPTAVPTTATVPATTTVVPPKVPCLQHMKDQGVVPKDKLTVTKTDGKDTATITVTPKKQGKDTPLWVSATFTPAEVKDIKAVASRRHAGGQPPKTGRKLELPITIWHLLLN